MSVRQIDSDHDWTFGQGRNNYITNNPEVVQDIDTRLSFFLGDCFFDLSSGIDWFNLLGQKNQLALNLAISAVIINSQNVTGILQLSANVSDARNFSVSYKVQTIYSSAAGVFQYSLNGIG